jgi:hypothetical protein
LQSGNLTSAQKAYTTIQQDVQQLASQGVHHHHHHTQSTQSADASSSNPLAQAFGSLGQALQSGNLTAAQTAYSTIQQDLAQFGMNLTSTAQATTSTVNVTG